MKLQAFRAFGFAAIAALLLASCGGGDSSPEFKRVVSFGDSLSDLGTYTPATSLTQTPGAPPFFGGRFTTNVFTGYTATNNTNIATIWVEYVAAKVGVPITPAEAGFAGQSVKCPAAAVPALAGSCTAYGQGGALVTNPNGIGKASGALTVPIVTQIANHLARFGSFNQSDIVFVFAGSDDIFVELDAFGAGAIDQATAVANVTKAATDLAALVKTEVLGKGARYVAVMNVPDITQTPFGTSLPAPGKAFLGALSDTFNQALQNGLAGEPVAMIDIHAIYADLLTNSAKYGFTNITDPACDAAKISAITGGQVTDGSPLFCNASPGQPFNGLAAGASPTTWFFADDVHPTTGGQKRLADAVIARLKELGWIAENL
jgi:outer membrane lipase/esterase